VRWVADAGATKTDWVELHTRHAFQTEGLNIEIEGEAQARNKLLIAAQRLEAYGRLTEIHYYGPALHRAATREVLQALLTAATGLPREKVHVYHDLLGAARAAWGKSAGIVCILGTGSNCAAWDGENITRQAGGHGYLLGDEGSGADLGRSFLSALLYDEVPTELQEAFWRWNPFSNVQNALDLRSAVYASLRPSAFLAQLAPFLSGQVQHPWVQALVRQRFQAFIQRTWGRWQSGEKVRYVGGIARAFETLLREETLRHGGQWAGTIPSVAQALAEYHAHA